MFNNQITFDPSKVEQTEYTVVKRYSLRAARDRVSLKDSLSTTWFRYDRDVAIVALYCKKNGVARIKSVWVAPEFRGKGIGTGLTEWLMKYAEEQGATGIEAYAHNPAFYAARGFRQISKNQYNVALMYRKVGKE